MIWMLRRQWMAECYCGHKQVDHDWWGFGDCLDCECSKYMEREVNGEPLAPCSEPGHDYPPCTGSCRQGG